MLVKFSKIKIQDWATIKQMHKVCWRMIKSYNTCDTRAIDFEVEERWEPTSEMHLTEIMGNGEN